MPNPAEVATLLVEGRRFEDWTSVWVQDRRAESETLFRFTAVERDPTPAFWQRLQFKPGDLCAIYLGHQLACAGVIVTRQTAYDANNHGVMLMGKGRTWYAARGSIIDKTGNYDGKTFEQVARQVIAPFGVGLKVIGKLDATPFRHLQKDPSDTVWTFLERAARQLGIIMGSDHEGNFLLIGQHKAKLVQGLVEGQNILRCQCVVDRQQVYSDIFLDGSVPAHNDKHGTAAAEQRARVKGSLERYSPLLTHALQPAWDQAAIKKYAQNKTKWSEGTQLTATITVQGWLREGGELWRAGHSVHVKSPMAMLDQEMTIKTATFTQDNNQGTLTILELVAPWMLNAVSDVNPGNDKAPQDPAQKPDAPQTPPATTTPEPPAASIAPIGPEQPPAPGSGAGTGLPPDSSFGGAP